MTVQGSERGGLRFLAESIFTLIIIMYTLIIRTIDTADVRNIFAAAELCHTDVKKIEIGSK